MNKVHCFPPVNCQIPGLLPSVELHGLPTCPTTTIIFSRYADAAWMMNPPPSRTAARASHHRSDGRSRADGGAFRLRRLSHSTAPETPPSPGQLRAHRGGGQTPSMPKTFHI